MMMLYLSLPMTSVESTTLVVMAMVAGDSTARHGRLYLSLAYLLYTYPLSHLHHPATDRNILAMAPQTPQSFSLFPSFCRLHHRIYAKPSFLKLEIWHSCYQEPTLSPKQLHDSHTKYTPYTSLNDIAPTMTELTSMIPITNIQTTYQAERATNKHVDPTTPHSLKAITF